MSAQIVSISCRSPKPLSRTLAPLAASARAMPRPIPLVDPVTMADRPTSILTGARVRIVFAVLINIAHPFHLRRNPTEDRDSLLPASATQPSRRPRMRSATLRERDVIGEMPGCYEV